MHKVLVNPLGGLSLPRKSVVRLTDRPDMTLDVYRARKTTMQQSLFILLATQSSLHLDNPKKIEIYPFNLSLKPVLERIQPKSGHHCISAHERTQFNRVCYFRIFWFVPCFQKIFTSILLTFVLT